MPTPLVWAWEGNSAEPVIEEYGYLTDVQESYNGTEQRVQLRRHPTGSIEFSFFVESVPISAAGQSTLAEASALQSALWSDHGEPWIVPLWYYATRLTAQANAGASTISLASPVSTVPFRDPLGLGRYALLWKDSRTYEVVQISNAAGSLITTFAPLAGTWPTATSWCLPCRVGRLQNVVGLKWAHSLLLEGRVKFTFEAAEDVDSVPA